MRGGKRSGAGRKPGAATKRTREIADKAAETGETPLEYMLRRMRDPAVEHSDRDKLAVAAAPYVHARLATVEHQGNVKHSADDTIIALMERIAQHGRAIHNPVKS